jgi:hypothetical protein
MGFLNGKKFFNNIKAALFNTIILAPDLTLIRMTKDEKDLAVFKDSML